MDKKLVIFVSLIIVVLVGIIFAGTRSINKTKREILAEHIETKEGRESKYFVQLWLGEVEEPEKEEPVVEVYTVAEKPKIDGSSFVYDLQIEEVFMQAEYLQKIRNVFVFNDVSLTDGRYYNLEMKIKRTSRRLTLLVNQLEDIGVFDSESNEYWYEMILGKIQHKMISSDEIFNNLKENKLIDFGTDIDKFVKDLGDVEEILTNYYVETYNDFLF